MRAVGWGAAGCVMMLAGGAWAQRPSDEDLFGGGESAERREGTEGKTATATATTTTTTTTTGAATRTGMGTAKGTGDARDELNLGNPEGATRFSAEVAPADPLRIGGQLYWRVMSTGKQGTQPQNWGLSAPALMDVYMDARPNDRVRAFVLGRMFYDPTLPATVSSSSPSAGGGSVSVQATDFLASASGQQTRGPTVLLDQLWLRADILRTVFVTAGKQHVRWGTARFWAPTDYLHMVPRNPLLPFDSRTGTTMLKLHMPWEERSWNFYAYALPQGPDTASGTDNGFKTGDVAVAARAEAVVGTLEAGLGVFGDRYSKAKFAGDVSFAWWDLDFYGEAALRNAGDVDFVSFDGQPSIRPNGSGQFVNGKTGDTVDNVTVPFAVDGYFPVRRGSGWKPQVTGGVSYTRQYADKDTVTVGAEYFYNALGYDDPRVYPGVIFLPHTSSLKNPAVPFYLGRHYAGIYATAPAPYSWDNTTFTVSTLANLSDKSGITRLDYSVVVLTHLRFEAYGAVHWGQRNGEFRFGIDGSALTNTGNPTVDDLVQPIAGRLNSPPSLFDLGVGLRVAL